MLLSIRSSTEQTFELSDSTDRMAPSSFTVTHAPSLKLHPFSYETLFSKLPSKPNILVNRYPPTSVVPLHCGAPACPLPLCSPPGFKIKPSFDNTWQNSPRFWLVWWFDENQASGSLGLPLRSTWKRNLVSCLKPGTCLAKPGAGALKEPRVWILGT